MSFIDTTRGNNYTPINSPLSKKDWEGWLKTAQDLQVRADKEPLIGVCGIGFLKYIHKEYGLLALKSIADTWVLWLDEDGKKWLKETLG